ncbi:MAG TPA: radical SAM protein [Elusimicrobia bacterium]|nr:radical SAM protein [Elusimicrobiota bacterium]
MENKKSQAKAIDNGIIALPPETARKLGLSAGAHLDIVVRRGRVEILPDIHSLSRVYIEPTSNCNLTCRACIQRTWSEPQGNMTQVVFNKLLKDLRHFPHLESVMLGGFGEPTAHPDVIQMVAALKETGARVEMVSNGTLLDAKMAEGLLDARLDRLWISFDGADELNFERARQGARFKEVVGNLKRLRDKLELGIAFVVSRSNFADLKNLSWLAKKTGAIYVSVSNIIPYSPEMEHQMVCAQALTLNSMAQASGRVEVDLPRIDINEATKDTLWRLAGGNEAVSLMGTPLGARIDECRFIRERCAFIRWDGQVSPCMALLHSHVIHFHGAERRNTSHSFGNIAKRDLLEIWNAPDYISFREKVSKFDFAPCHVCGGCGYSAENKEDCGGNIHPAVCGGCLWAQGIIQCP